MHRTQISPDLKGDLPALEDPHPKYPSLSSAVTVEVSPDKGRKIMAVMDVDVGEVVLVEKPNTTFFCPNTEKVSIRENIFIFFFSLVYCFIYFNY